MPKKNFLQLGHIPLRKSILGQTFLQTLLITVVSALALTLCAFLIAGSLLKQRVFLQLSAVATSKMELIERRLQTDRERASLLGTRTEVQNALSGGDTLKIAALLGSLQEEGIPILGITVTDTFGKNRAHAGLPTLPVLRKIDATEIVPMHGKEGWEGHTVFSPILDSRSGSRRGTLVVRYAVQELLQSVLNASSVGETGEVILGMKKDNELILLNNSFAPKESSPLSLGVFDQQLVYGSNIAKAISEQSGVSRTEDYLGKDVLAAYRFLPSIGWGLVVKIEVAEALKGVRFLAIILTVISALLLGLSGFVAFRLAQHLIGPLMHLAKKMSKLGPNHWQFRRSVKTGDEVEVLDRVVADMADRLKKTYEYMEDEIEARTKELKKQYLKDRTILESIDHGVLLVDTKGKITDANPAALEMLQCEGDACMQSNIEDVFRVYQHGKLLSADKHPIAGSLKKRSTVRSMPNARYSVMRSDKIRIPILLVVKPFIENGRLMGAIAVFQDETEARRVDYLKSEFISLASHQLRTPLSSLQWYIELFGDEGKLSSDQREYLKEMSIASQRMVKLIDSLLHAARLEGGDLVPHTHQLDIAELVTDLAEELRSLAKSKKIGCTVDISKHKIAMNTDSILLNIVFKNLFSNAVKYTEKGGEVGVSLTKKGNWVEIVISDTGIGIPKKEHKHIFQKLFRASNVLQMDTDGNGLGLYITKVIIDNLGGTVSFKSAEKKGTTFIIRLPIKTQKKNTKNK